MFVCAVEHIRAGARFRCVLGGCEQVRRAERREAVRRIPGLLDHAVFLLLAVLMVPVAILAVATPLALFVRLLLEIAKRM